MGALSVRDQTHWHELRSQHIGASEVAALFDMSPFTTLWQLWMEKSGKLPPEDLSDNKSVQAGTFLESGIANWAAHRWDMKIEKVVDYYTADDCPGMGASLDFQTDGGHPVEIKWSAHGDGWEYEGDTITCAPDNYVLQVLHQMACTDAEYGWLIALIRNEPRRMKVPRSEEIISKIKSHVAKFWDSVSCGAEPPVDFDKDGEAVVRLLDFVPMSEVTLTIEHAHLFQTYLENAAIEKEAKAKKDAAKTELLTLSIEAMGKMNTSQDKAIVKCGDHKLSISTIKASVGTEITAEMIGNFYGARSGYKKVTVSK
jgi:putative phage-type endonuclease